MKRILVIALVAALSATAAKAQPWPALDIWVQAGGGSAVTVGPNCEVPYYVVGELTDVPNMGLALVGFDLEFDGGDLSHANAPTSTTMGNFVIPDGITNPVGATNPVGYGGTLIGGKLVQVGGGQNTIMNGQVECTATIDCPTGSECDVIPAPPWFCTPVATFPVGTVITGIAQNGYPEVLVSGALTAPAGEGPYTLAATNLFANVIKPGQDGNPFWATAAADDGGTLTPLSITVQIGAQCPAAAMTSDPASGAIDARQPHAVSGNTTPVGWDTVDLFFTFVDVSGLQDTDLTVTESGGDGTAPGIQSVTPMGLNMVEVVLDSVIEPDAWTVITHDASGVKTCLGYLPGDASQNGTSEPADIDALISVLNSGGGLVYATDINRSGNANAQDLLRVVDLLNGAGDFSTHAWNGESLPASPCP